MLALSCCKLPLLAVLFVFGRVQLRERLGNVRVRRQQSFVLTDTDSCIPFAHKLMVAAHARAPVRPMWGSTADLPAQWMTNFNVVRSLYKAAYRAGRSFHMCEIGFGPGYSALSWLAATTRDCSQPQDGGEFTEFSLPISKSEAYAAEARASHHIILQTFPRRRAKFVWGSSSESVPAHSGPKCDAWHIDGDHRYEGVFKDVLAARKRSVAGAIVLFDDLQIPGVARAVGEAEKRGALELLGDINVTVRHGRAIPLLCDLNITGARPTLQKAFSIGRILIPAR